MTEVEIRISGSGGQGILLAGRILAEALTMEKLNVAQSQSYEPTSRGGLSRSDLVASVQTVDYPLASSLDYLVVLHKIATGASDALLKESSFSLIDTSLADYYAVGKGKSLYLPIIETAKKMGNVRSTNMIALGALLELGEICEQQTILDAIAKVAPAKLVEPATEAVKKGYLLAQNAEDFEQNSRPLERVPLASV